ncbi:hypothetical protein ACKGJO_06745 [Gracilimonas sp. Q87]|uniref:hypothetical protein n=1 Tax=Gracilimonas sp. Q87 TaxID=3384766 RepID=UPI00398448AB
MNFTQLQPIPMFANRTTIEDAMDYAYELNKGTPDPSLLVAVSVLYNTISDNYYLMDKPVIEDEVMDVMDSARGVYIPRDFCAMLLSSTWVWYGVHNNTISYLESHDPYNGDHYWDNWEQTLDNLRVVIDDQVYMLHQNCDLFLVPVDIIDSPEFEEWSEA